MNAPLRGTGLASPSRCAWAEAEMGGTISLESKPGQGSTFRLTIPAGRAPGRSVEIPLGNDTNRACPSWWWTNNATNRRILGETLTRWGHAAYSGRQRRRRHPGFSTP